MEATDRLSLSAWLLIVASVLALASLPRLWNLGGLSFSGDEEITALVSRSYLEDGSAKMPSGMPYRRALPVTVASSYVAGLLGSDKEAAYRLPAALSGIFTAAILFFVVRKTVGLTAAMVACVLLATSEWHILLSREARMYAPFLLFFICSAYALTAWSILRKSSLWVAGVISWLAASSLHPLAAFLAAFPILPLLVQRGHRSRELAPLATSALCFFGSLIYMKFVEVSGFTEWKAAASALPPLPADYLPPLENLRHKLVATVNGPISTPFSLVIGLILGWRLAQVDNAQYSEEHRHWITASARYIMAIFTAIAFCLGLVYGAALALAFYVLINPWSLQRICRLRPWTMTLLLAMALVCISLRASNTGLKEAIKASVAFPFPYPIYFLDLFPGVSLLALGVVIYLLTVDQSRRPIALNIASLATIAYFLGFGLVSSWGGMRYLLPAYPMVLLLASFAICTTAAKLLPPNWQSRVFLERSVVLLLVLSGLLGGHGLLPAAKVALLDHRQRYDLEELSITTLPDHRSAGLFVRSRLQPDDIVVAEDSLQQFWYIGRVDYWLRDPQSHAGFLYYDSAGTLRDFYLDSAIADIAEIQRPNLSQHRRIWIVTSAETMKNRRHYMSQEQIAWLEHIEHNFSPEFVAADQITAVYCMNCSPSEDGARLDHALMRL